MTLETIGVLVGLGAIALAAGATKFDISPWRIFGLATIAGVVTLWDVARGAAVHCGPATTSVVELLLGVVAVLGLTLYGAAALRAVIDGVRLGKAGDPVAAVSRCLACPLASAVSVGILLYALLLAAIPCLD
jgi:hypothetical protein